MRRRTLRPAGAAFPAALAVALVAGCTAAGPGPSAAGSSAPPAARQCGTARTVANVPVLVEVDHGQVPCPTAMTIEQDYQTALASGKAPGNGGGGPVTVKGWTCVGFNTPQVLSTGHTSKCTNGSSEILAVLPTPTMSPSS